MVRRFNLNLRHILWRAATYYPRKEVVSVNSQGVVERLSYSEIHARVRRLAGALRGPLNLKSGDRVASVCWNTARHLELHFAVPLSEMALHTVNLRFSAEQVVASVNDAGDKVVFADPDQLPLLERIAGELKTVKAVVLTEGSGKLEGIETLRLEDLLSESEEADLIDVDEDRPAAVCFTTGTTGQPKGVIYTHRGIFLRAMATCMADTYAVSERDVMLHVVPLYHISSWFMPYAATLVGSKQVLPGPHPSVERIVRLILDEGVTVSDGVPTVWLNVLSYARERGIKRLGELRRIVVGGSAVPEALIRGFAELGVEVIHAWGMTETYDSAVATYIKSHLRSLPDDEQVRLRVKQGLPFPGIEVDAVDESGRRVPWDGATPGELVIRGAWIVDGYFNNEEATRASFTGDWFRTGDVVTIDPEGYVELVDRLKDLIKSGGEWISSIAVENAIMSHPAVREAAVFAVPHEKWGERPVAVVALKEGARVGKEELLDFIKDRFPKYWLPDEVLFVEEVPKTSVGKFDKKLLRATYRDLLRRSSGDSGQA